MVGRAPLLMLAVTLIAIHLWGGTNSYESPRLLLLGNLFFTTSVSLIIATLAGHSFLVSGRLPLLAISVGMTVWGTSALIAVVGGHLGNYNITIHNGGVAVSGLCHLIGALTARVRKEHSTPRPGGWLTIGVAVGLGAVALIWMGTLEAWWPIFFDGYTGATAVRRSVLITAIAVYVVAATLTADEYRKSGWRFLYWYSLAWRSLR